jgi:hypothetical protein
MEKIELKKLPERYINYLKKEFEEQLMLKYKLMGVNFDLNESEIKTEFNKYFENLIFFYDKFKMRYYYAEIKRLHYGRNL